MKNGIHRGSSRKKNINIPEWFTLCMIKIRVLCSLPQRTDEGTFPLGTVVLIKPVSYSPRVKCPQLPGWKDEDKCTQIQHPWKQTFSHWSFPTPQLMCGNASSIRRKGERDGSHMITNKATNNRNVQKNLIIFPFFC